jgi:hypothetical protein
MTLRIVRRSDGPHTVLRLSSRIRSGDLQEIREQMDGHTRVAMLDLEESTLVDVDVVCFLGMCEAQGSNSYIPGWISGNGMPTKKTSGGWGHEQRKRSSFA